MEDMFRSIGQVIAHITIASAVLSYVLLIEHAFEFGMSPVFALLIEYYDGIKAGLLAPFMPPAEYLSNVIADAISIDLNLAKHWGDVFLLLGLYLGARAGSYWHSGRRRHASERMLLGLSVAFLTSVLAGLWPEDSLAQGIGKALTVVVGLLIFDIIDAAWAAAVYRKASQTFFDEFSRYLGYCLPATALLLIVILAGASAMFIGFLTAPDRHGSVLLLLGSLSLVPYWASRGWMISGSPDYRPAEASRYQRFRQSSATKTAVHMTIVIAGAIVICAMNAGHILVSNP